MASILTVSEVSALNGMDETQRPTFFSFLANAKRVPLADIMKEFADKLESAKEFDKREAAKVQAAELARKLDSVRIDAESFRYGTVAANGDEHGPELLDELRSRAEELGGWLVFSGIVEDSPRYTVKVQNPASAPTVASAATGTRGGGTGAGRPAANAPQPFVTADGKRVVGPVTLWLKANVTVEVLKAKGIMKEDGSLKGSGSVVAAAAVKAGILIESPVPATAPAAATASTPSA